MPKTPFPARIHVVFASTKPHAVVFRRGPSKKVCTFGWDRSKDTFTLGQWLKGRIYERRADLSPSGRYLIYFAMNGKWDSETRGSWTAVSRAPWLKALELYGKGDCWEGGGLFLSDREFWLNDRYFNPALILKTSSEVKRNEKYKPEQQFGAECTGVYYVRLLRDGWQLINRENVGSWHSTTTFERKLSKNWVLRKIAHEQVGAPPGKGCYWDEHELVNYKSDECRKHKHWEWAEKDGNSLVWAEKGCLYRAKMDRLSELGATKLLYDFNQHTFEEIEAPY